MNERACWAQAGSDLEMALGTMASMQATTEDEWHEEVAQLSPKQLVEATFQRLFPDSFLYVLPVWKHKVRSSDNMQVRSGQAFTAPVAVPLRLCSSRVEAQGLQLYKHHRLSLQTP